MGFVSPFPSFTKVRFSCLRRRLRALGWGLAAQLWLVLRPGSPPPQPRGQGMVTAKPNGAGGGGRGEPRGAAATQEGLQGRWVQVWLLRGHGRALPGVRKSP